jgi:hypothetical protein
MEETLLEFYKGHHRPKDFILRDCHVVLQEHLRSENIRTYNNEYKFMIRSTDLDVGEDGGLNVVSLVATGLPSSDQRGAFTHSYIDVLENLLVLILVNLHCDFTNMLLLQVVQYCHVPNMCKHGTDALA